MRGRGIASECLRRVQRQAAAADLELRLHVVNGNPAQRLCERLGFRRGRAALTLRPLEEIPNEQT
jgi:ribosomal protein S18 acetylase RimI-like enzyme